jgi:hypothetical protein
MAVRTGDEAGIATATSRLAAIAPDALAADLSTDAARIATWINVYNAATQLLVRDDPERYSRRAHFFRTPAVTVAARPLSLDAIEHGLLRRSRWKAGLGWLTNPLPGPFERRFRVRRPDPRIHFVLNCAAGSCPPVGVYDRDRLDAQLELATRAYLTATVRRDAGRLVVPRTFLWFMGDFGGRSGVRRFLERHGIRPGSEGLRFASWDWSLAPARWMPPDDRGSPS